MDNYTIVRKEHLNHYGYLFGGKLLSWVDEFAWIFASLDFPGCSLVTVGMDQVSFKERVENGSILRFQQGQWVQFSKHQWVLCIPYNQYILYSRYSQWSQWLLY